MLHHAFAAVALALLLAVTTVWGQEGDDYYSLNFSGRSAGIVNLLGQQRNRGGRNIVFLIDPMVCPRCEGAAITMMESLREVETGGALFCVLNYPRLGSVRNYAMRRRFPLPVAIDTSGAIFREIGLAQAPPFITVWDSVGRLLYAKAIFGVDTRDTTLWRDILRAGSRNVTEAIGDQANPFASHNVAQSVGLAGASPDWKSPAAVRTIQLQEDSAHALGMVNFLAVNPDKSILTITDDLSLTVKGFAVADGRMLFELRPDFATRRFFSSELTDEEFTKFERMGISSTMYFSSIFTGGDTVVVSASLPRFTRMVGEIDVEMPIDRDSAIEYMNMAAFLTYKIPEGRLLRIQEIQSPYDSLLVADHATTRLPFNRSTGEVALSVNKGYPLVGTTSAVAVGGNDPTLRAFYDDAPLYWTYDLRTGARRRVIGRLDSVCYRHGIGYAMASPSIAFDGEKFSVAQNPVASIVDEREESFPLKSYFNPDVLYPARMFTRLPSVEALKHLADSSAAFIAAMERSNDDLYLAWKVKRLGVPLIDDHFLVVQRYSIGGKTLREEWSIPHAGELGNLVDFTIAPADGEIHCIYQSAMRTHLVTYRLR